MIPLLPLYAEKYRPSPLAFGLLMSSYSAMQFLFAPILGRLSDRFGRRPVLLFSLAGTVVGYLLFAFARSLPLLFASRLLDGATGGNIGTAQAIIADTTSREDRARGMGLVGMAFALGFIFGPAIGGFTVAIDQTAPGLAAASLSFAAFVWAFLKLPETRPEGGARQTVLGLLVRDARARVPPAGDRRPHAALPRDDDGLRDVRVHVRAVRVAAALRRPFHRRLVLRLRGRVLGPRAGRPRAAPRETLR